MSSARPDMSDAPAPGAPPPEGPPRRRRILLAVLLLLLAVLAAWLLWPPARPDGWLLGRMPPAMRLGIELRDAPRLWQEGRLRERLDRLAGRIAPFRPAWEAPLRRAVRDLDGVLSRSALWTDHALSGAVAVGVADPGGRDAVLLATLDNATRLYLRARIALGGERASGLPPHLRVEAGGRVLHLALARGLLVGATTPDRLGSVLDRLGGNASRAADGAFAAGGALPPVPGDPGSLLLALGSAPADAAGWPARLAQLERARVVWTPRAGPLRAEAVLRPESLDAVWMTSRTAPDPGAVAGAAPARGLLAGPDGGDAGALRVAGRIDPAFGWTALRQALWPGRGRPVRGASLPAEVFLFDLLHHGCLPEADGRFHLALSAPPALGDDLGVPPAPVLRLGLGMRDGLAGSTRFDREVRRAVDYFRAPGGHEWFEAVRRETRLRPVYAGRAAILHLRLHPLFFNHLSPAWRFTEDRAVFASVLTALPDPAAYRAVDLPAPPPPAGGPGRGGAAGAVPLRLRLAGSSPAALRAAREVLEMKAVDHGYAPPGMRERLFRTADAVLALLNGLGDAGTLDLALHRIPNADAAAPAAPASRGAEAAAADPAYRADPAVDTVDVHEVEEANGEDADGVQGDGLDAARASRAPAPRAAWTLRLAFRPGPLAPPSGTDDPDDPDDVEAVDGGDDGDGGEDGNGDGGDGEDVMSGSGPGSADGSGNPAAAAAGAGAARSDRD